MSDSAPAPNPVARIRDFDEFYTQYLREHSHPISRRLHVVGSTAGLVGVTTALATRSWKPALLGLVAGYGLAWIGHFGFEKNRPATFRQPLYSLMGDWRMLSDMVRGRLTL